MSLIDVTRELGCEFFNPFMAEQRTPGLESWTPEWG